MWMLFYLFEKCSLGMFVCVFFPIVTLDAVLLSSLFGNVWCIFHERTFFTEQRHNHPCDLGHGLSVLVYMG